MIAVFFFLIIAVALVAVFFFLIVAVAIGVVLGEMLYRALPVIVIVLAIGYIGSQWDPGPSPHVKAAAVTAPQDNAADMKNALAECDGDVKCRDAVVFADRIEKSMATK